VTDLDRLRRKYRDLTDSEIAEFHTEGPQGSASVEGWRLLDEEFKRRGLDPVMALGPGAKVTKSSLDISGSRIPLTDVIWAYEKVTKTLHTINLLPIYRDRDGEVVVRIRDGSDLVIPAIVTGDDELVINGRRTPGVILRRLASHAPWIIIGFDEALDRAWNDPSQRRAVIDRVDNQRRLRKN